MSFTQLGLSETLQETVKRKGYEAATPIQQEAIPAILAGRDVMAGAQTGTGKTAAFALPVIQTLLAQDTTGSEDRKIQALILTPTRELAQQVTNSLVDYSVDSDLKTVVAYGGVSVNTQLKALADGVDILVATPGRLIDHITRGSVSLESLKFLVLDEADRMLDMGFIDDIHRILRHVPEQRQTLFFSATFDEAIFKLSKNLLNDPELIEVDQRNAAATDVEQIAYEVDKDKKREITSFLIGSNNWQQVLIFVRTKQGADLLAKELKKDGLKASAIHGDKSQGARERALEEFKEGKIRALVATDVASRGLDIEQLKHVINYELPHNAEDYIHRIGRTGRAGEKGQAITLLSADETWLLDQIHEILDTRLLQQWLPGYEPDLTKSFSAPAKNKKPSRSSGKSGDRHSRNRNRR